MTALSLVSPLPHGTKKTGLDRIIHGLASWKEKRDTRRALMKLTARELDDIGLTRTDIEKLF